MNDSEIEKLLPTSYYSDRTVEFRLQKIIKEWQKMTTILVDELREAPRKPSADPSYGDLLRKHGIARWEGGTAEEYSLWLSKRQWLSIGWLAGLEVRQHPEPAKDNKDEDQMGNWPVR